MWSLKMFAACVALLSAASAHAATPEQMQAVAKTVTNKHPTAPNVTFREMYSVILNNEEWDITFVIEPDPDQHNEPSLGVVIKAGSRCAYVLADFKFDGIVDESGKICFDGLSTDGARFFAQFGGAQILYNKVIEEALK